MDTDENIKFAITLVLFAITIGTLVWRMSANNTKVNAELKRLDDCVEDIRRTDARQDASLNRIDEKTTKIDRSLAIVATKTESIKEATTSIMEKLDRMTDALNRKNNE